MRILGCVPVYRDSPLDALWLELAKSHEVDLWGAGREGYVAGLPLGEVQARFGGEPYDLALAADPARKGSEWWDFAGLDAGLCAAFVHDGCYGVEGHTRWARQHRLDLVLVRGRDDVAAVRRLMPTCRVEWLPFGIDPGIFRDYGEPTRYDVGIFGHLGHPYPVRERAREVLRRQGGLRVLDATLGGCEHPEATGAGYARLINSCRVAVATCGVHRYVFMKYYEVPACGVALVANRPAHGFGRLFVPGMHLEVFRDDCSDLAGLLGELLADDARRERLARAGREHVLARHTNARRVAQLEEIVAGVP